MSRRIKRLVLVQVEGGVVQRVVCSSRGITVVVQDFDDDSDDVCLEADPYPVEVVKGVKAVQALAREDRDEAVAAGERAAYNGEMITQANRRQGALWDGLLVTLRGVLNAGAKSPTELARRLDVPLEAVCAALVVLENQGMIRKAAQAILAEGGVDFYEICPQAAAPAAAPAAHQEVADDAEPV